jgi:hypothetical protein
MSRIPSMTYTQSGVCVRETAFVRVCVFVCGRVRLPKGVKPWESRKALSAKLTNTCRVLFSSSCVMLYLTCTRLLPQLTPASRNSWPFSARHDASESAVKYSVTDSVINSVRLHP